MRDSPPDPAEPDPSYGDATAAARFGFSEGLKSEVFGAVWWCALAPLLYPIGIIAIFQLVTPELAEAVFAEEPDARAMQSQWIVMTLVQLLLFWRMTEWGVRKGFGPLSGQLNPSALWIAAALLIGPGAYSLAGEAAGFFASGDGNWATASGETSPLLSPDGISLTAFGYAVLLAPLCAEIAFRGIGMGWLIARGVPAIGAVMLTSLVWALLMVHLSPLGMMSMFLFGLVLGGLRVLSRGMSAPIAAHVATNAWIIWSITQST